MKKIFFVIDCPPGFSQLGPTFAEYMLKYNGLQYTKFCYVLSQDRTDIKATVRHLKRNRIMWGRIKKAVLFAKTNTGNYNKIKEINYWRELLDEEYDLREKINNLNYNSCLYVIINKNIANATKKDTFDELYDHICNKNKENIVDYIPYEEFLALSYTDYENKLTETLSALKPYDHDLLSWMQNEEYRHRKKRAVSYETSMRLMIFQYLLRMLRIIDPKKLNFMSESGYSKNYLEHIKKEFEHSGTTQRYSEKGYSENPIAVIRKLKVREEKENDIGKVYDDFKRKVRKQSSCLKGLYETPVLSCLCYYLVIIFSRLKMDGYVLSITKVFDFLKKVKSGLPCGYNSTYSFDIKGVETFFSTLEEDLIHRKYKLLEGIMQIEGEENPSVSFIKRNLFKPNFPFNELWQVYHGIPNVIIDPYAVRRMLNHLLPMGY